GGTAVQEPPEVCVHDLVRQVARRTPDAVAVAGEGSQLSYGELVRRAGRLAARLRGLGVGPGTPVAICAERSPDLVVSLLGILAAGGAYLPLDPTQPQERLAAMLDDSRSPVLLVDEPLAHLFDRGASRHTLMLHPGCEVGGAGPTRPAYAAAAPEDLAYVIYTSGSTGRPKGVGVRHANVARLFTATAEWFRFGPDDVWSLFHSCAFDFSVWEIWGALAHGGRLVVVPYWVSRSPEAFWELLARERVTVLNQTPSAFRQLIWAEEAVRAGGGSGPDLRLVV